jgi:hypothetical protein
MLSALSSTVQSELSSAFFRLADLLFLAESSIGDIRYTLSFESAMKDGVLKGSAMLDEIWPTRTPLPARQYEGPAQTPTCTDAPQEDDK